MDKKQVVWNRISYKDLPDAPDDAATLAIGVSYRGKELTRGITVTQTGQQSFAGLVLNKGKVTGWWRWNIALFANPVFVSNCWVNEKGQHKRYAGGLPICRTIRNLILSYLEGERVAA